MKTIHLTMLLLAASLVQCTGNEFYVGPNGKPDATGAKESPWDIETAFSGKNVPPGSTIWLQGGVYRHEERGPHAAYVVRSLHGTAEAPIRIRAVPGQRVTIDGGIRVSMTKEFAAFVIKKD